MNLTPRQLRIFLSLTETLNFSRTAQSFRLSQPALSKIIRGIEAEMGLTLFARTTRMVRLTAEGNILAQLARRLVEDFEAGLAEMRGVARRHTERLSIAALPSLAAMLLPGAARVMRDLHPGIRIAIHDALSDTTVDLLHARAVDFSLTSGDPYRAETTYEEIMRDNYVLLCRKDNHALLDRAPIGILGSLELDLISMPKGTAARQYADAALLSLGVQFRPAMAFAHLATIGKFVHSGFGVALLPCLAALMIREEELVIVDLVDPPVRSLGIVERRGEAASPVAVEIKDIIRRRIDALCAQEPRRLFARRQA